MGEYFRIVNLDRRQYFSGHSLNLSGKFSGLQGEPLGSLVVWVLTKTSHLDAPRFRGAWANDRVVIAGDEGINEAIYRAADGYEDVSVPLLEEWIDADVFRAMDYWERGLVDDDGRYSYSREVDRERIAAEREGTQFPFEKWEHRHPPWRASEVDHKSPPPAGSG